MALSRQFKALGKIGGVFAGAWAAIGVFVGMFAGGPFLPSLLTYGFMFGAVGGISGITTALLAARGESGREINEVPTWRATLWGFLGGFGPAALFTLAVPPGAAASAVVPLLVLGLLCGGIGGAISGAAAASAKRVELSGPDDQPKLPAT
jgi:hypothetical protein